MEEGSFRCDANVSVRPAGATELGVKVEVKNMNSFKNVQRALEYEIRRQIKALREGEALVQETRLWNADQEITLSMRSKEHAHDYRYFPDPDLVPLVVEPAWIEEIRRNLPELPEAKRRRFVRDYGIPEYDAGVLTASKELAEYYEACVRAQNDPKAASNWVMVELLGRLNKDGKDITESPIPPARLAVLLDLLAKGTISGKMAKEFFDEMYASGADPVEILKAKGGQITDAGELEAIVRAVVEKHAGPVAEYRGGKETAFNFLVGQVMRATKGKANPKLVNELLKKILRRLTVPGPTARLARGDADRARGRSRRRPETTEPPSNNEREATDHGEQSAPARRPVLRPRSRQKEIAQGLYAAGREPAARSARTATSTRACSPIRTTPSARPPTSSSFRTTTSSGCSTPRASPWSSSASPGRTAARSRRTTARSGRSSPTTSTSSAPPPPACG